MIELASSNSSGVCVFGVMPKETEYSEFGSGDREILGVSFSSCRAQALGTGASIVVALGLTSCGTWAQLLGGM